MDAVQATSSQARAVAIAELFAFLDSVLRSYRVIPQDEAVEERWAADADLITGEIARRLAVARACMSRTSPPRSAPLLQPEDGWSVPRPQRRR